MSCTVTFKQSSVNLADALKKAYPNSGERTDFSTIYTETKLHTAPDYDDSTTYYFTGNPNNWVSFAGHLWRVIRINGDGSVRILYAGSGGSDGYIGESSFNSSYNSPAYVGWKYTLGNPDTLSTSRGNGTPSTIYTYIKTNWYDTLTIEQKSYINTNALYCNDRNTSYSGTSSTINFPAYNRLVNKQVPTYACEVGDRFSDGFGLMTADEVVFAGGLYNKFNSFVYYYRNISGESLVSGHLWWTMTPSNFNNTSNVWVVLGSTILGDLSSNGVHGTGAVRPVTSLKSCVTVSPTGDGSGTNPYVVNGTC